METFLGIAAIIISIGAIGISVASILESIKAIRRYRGRNSRPEPTFRVGTTESELSAEIAQIMNRPPGDPKNQGNRHDE